jgi:hypothetical protein
MKLRVELNGTDTNPWHRCGLTQNPFPQLGTAETNAACLHLQKLGGDPIPDEAYIRAHLKDWSPEFVDLCCARFEKGKVVRFYVHWKK